MPDEMTRQELTAMGDFLSSVHPFMRPGKCAEAISRLRDRLDMETKTEARVWLLAELALAFMIDGNSDDSFSAVRECIDLDPNDPINWCRLASWHTLEKNPSASDLESALEAVDTAVEIARLHGGELRYCLNARCRIAIAMQRYDILEKSLREILETTELPGIQFEGDFLPRIPEGAIDADLLAEYKALLAEQAARRAKRRASS